MLQLKNLLMIGAAGKDAGKTEFACHLIRKFKDTEKVIALKVTTIHEPDGRGQRGGEGYGDHSLLKDKYCLTEETGRPVDKDTVRMLHAGAQKVFWLQAPKGQLEEGFHSFQKTLAGDELIICESNSLRWVVEPGLFIIMRNKVSQSIKPSCKAVWEYSDYINDYDLHRYEISPDRLVFMDQGWKLIDPASARRRDTVT